MRVIGSVVLAGVVALSLAACGETGVACPDGTEAASSVLLANNVQSLVGDVEVGVANTVSVRDGLSTTEQSTLSMGSDEQVRVVNGDTVEIGGVAWLVDVRFGDDLGVELVECR